MNKNITFSSKTMFCFMAIALSGASATAAGGDDVKQTTPPAEKRTDPNQKIVTVARTFKMDSRISVQLDGYRQCKFVKATGVWNPWREGHADGWIQCGEHPTIAVKDNYISADFDQPGNYGDNRGDCTFVFECVAESSDRERPAQK